jgi:hypothetical protein
MRRVVVFLPLVLLAVACGGGGGWGSRSGAADPSLTALLANVPDVASSRTGPIFYSSLARLRGGDTASSFEEDITLLMDRSSLSVTLPGQLSGLLDPGFAEFAGFDSRQIRATIEFGGLPESTAVIVGTMTAGSVTAGLASSPGGDGLLQSKGDGVTYLSLGDEDSNAMEERSAVRPFGGPLRLAFVDGTLLWANSDATVEACVVARAGSSLADDPQYRAIAAALDDAAAVLLRCSHRGTVSSGRSLGSGKPSRTSRRRSPSRWSTAPRQWRLPPSSPSGVTSRKVLQGGSGRGATC